MWAMVIGMAVSVLMSCKLDMPKETESSYETMTVDTTDIEVPIKYSKIAQLTEEDLQRKYVQTVIDAGNQVNEAFADCQAAREKYGYYHRQIEVLRQAYLGTHELMDNGKSNYLEVLTAQETLLNAQLSEAMNMYYGAQAVIALYIALGGGTR